MPKGLCAVTGKGSRVGFTATGSHHTSTQYLTVTVACFYLKVRQAMMFSNSTLMKREYEVKFG